MSTKQPQPYSKKQIIIKLALGAAGLFLLFASVTDFFTTELTRADGVILGAMGFLLFFILAGILSRNSFFTRF